MMMMMLTTQLAYPSTLSASARSQALQSNTPFTTNNPSTAIGLVETDAYEATNPSTPVVGTPQVRSGKIGMIGVGLCMFVAALVTAMMANEHIRNAVLKMFQNIPGVKREEPSSHRSQADEISDSLPDKNRAQQDEVEENNIKRFHRQHSPKVKKEQVSA